MIITPIQIRFSDMDPMQRVNNSVYSSYLELGRLDFCKKYISIKTLQDIPFVLVRVELDILNSLRPGKKQMCTHGFQELELLPGTLRQILLTQKQKLSMQKQRLCKSITTIGLIQSFLFLVNLE